MPTRDEEGVLCIAGRVFLRHEKGVKIPETALNEIVCRHLREPANQNAHDSHFHYFFLLIRDINKPQLNFNETSACFNSKWWIIQRHALVELNHSTFLDVTNHKIRQPDYISDWYKIYHTHIILNIKKQDIIVTSEWQQQTMTLFWNFESIVWMFWPPHTHTHTHTHTQKKSPVEAWLYWQEYFVLERAPWYQYPPHFQEDLAVLSAYFEQGVKMASVRGNAQGVKVVQLELLRLP